LRRVNSWFLRIGGLFIGVFMLLYVLPLALTLVYSLVQRPNNLVFVGADNYLAVLGNRYFRLAFSNTLMFLVYAIPLTLLSCLAAAYLLDRIGLIMLLPFMVIPMLLPSASVALIFKQLFDPFQGLLRRFISAESLPMLSLIVFYFWKHMGFFTLLIITGQRMLSPAIFEAAMIDGASPFKAYIRVSLPQLRPMLLFAGALLAAYALRMYREAYMLYGAYPPESVYLLTHYQQNHFTKLNYTNLSVSAILFIVPTCIGLGFLLKLDRHWREDTL